VNNGVRYVLKDISLKIPSNTNIAVLGPNGAGKSTFLRLIGGSESADSGTIITDQQISWPLGLASGFQGSLTGRQNVTFVCSINGLTKDETRYVIKQVTAFAEIGEYFDMPVNTYSSGMRARLGFGLSMAFEFDVYLIDELTSVGDVVFREKANAAFEAIRSRASLIFVTHNLTTIKESCQAALFLRDGLADFYPNIDDGLDAYADYILTRQAKTAGTPEGRKMARMVAREIRRIERAKSISLINPNPTPPEE
jgi:capsular polysaccharide transport system ATP-binding protein